jgi:hypothetical protein
MDSNRQEYTDWYELEHLSPKHDEQSEICECKACTEELEFILRCD